MQKVNIVQPTKAFLTSETYTSMPYSDVFSKDLERGHVVYFGEESAKLQELIKGAVESVMLSGVTPEKALATLRAEAQELLDEQ